MRRSAPPPSAWPEGGPTLHELRAFAELAEELHFGRAARRLGVAQPSLSQAIRRLEARLGVLLLERTTRRVALTDMGARLLPHARGLIEDVAAMRALAATAGPLAGAAPPSLPRAPLRSGHVPAHAAPRRRGADDQRRGAMVPWRRGVLAHCDSLARSRRTRLYATYHHVVDD